MKKVFQALFVLCFALIVACPAQAAWQPTREIRILIPYNAGGQNDLCARKPRDARRYLTDFLAYY